MSDPAGRRRGDDRSANENPDEVPDRNPHDDHPANREDRDGANDAAADAGSRPRRSWHDTLTRLTHGVERRLDRARGRLRRPFQGGPILVEPYLGYGNGAHVRIRGRVLGDRGIGAAGPTDSMLTNLRNAWRRFDSVEVAGARVRLTTPEHAPAAPAGGAPLLDATATSDEEGFLDLDVTLPQAPRPGLLRIDFELLAPIPADQETTSFPGEAMITDPEAPFGVISDIDDTILVTGATRLRAVLSRTLLQNAHDRLPFPGVAALYRAFEAAGAPLFYVSSSPWNLYTVLTEFLDLNDIPVGPLLLRDWGVSAAEFLPLRHGDHKLTEIEGVLSAYPELGFLLVGDSGQEDPEIYAQVVRDFPGRVLGVVIRHVGDSARAEAVGELAATLAHDGVPLHLVQDSAEAARHAEAHGWIDEAGRRATERETLDSIGRPVTGTAQARV